MEEGSREKSLKFAKIMKHNYVIRGNSSDEDKKEVFRRISILKNRPSHIGIPACPQCRESVSRESIDVALEVYEGHEYIHPYSSWFAKCPSCKSKLLIMHEEKIWGERMGKLSNFKIAIQ